MNCGYENQLSCYHIVSSFIINRRLLLLVLLLLSLITRWYLLCLLFFWCSSWVRFYSVQIDILINKRWAWIINGLLLGYSQIVC